MQANGFHPCPKECVNLGNFNAQSACTLTITINKCHFIKTIAFACDGI